MTTFRVINCMLQKKSFTTLKSVKSFNVCVPHCATFCQTTSSNQKQLTKSTRDQNQVSTSFTETVKENTKSAWYLGVIIGGVGLTLALVYTVFRELFSSNSVNGVFSNAVKRLEEESTLVAKLGEPVKAYGEGVRRRRRIWHIVYYDEHGKKHMQMKFHVKGSVSSGTVYLEVKENESGNYEYSYMYCKLNDYMGTTFVFKNEEDKLNSQKNHDFM